MVLIHRDEYMRLKAIEKEYESKKKDTHKVSNSEGYGDPEIDKKASEIQYQQALLEKEKSLKPIPPQTQSMATLGDVMKSETKNDDKLSDSTEPWYYIGD